MPFRTEYGTHYHMKQGCCNASIPCDTTAELSPCSICCGSGHGGDDARPVSQATGAGVGSVELEPTDGPAVFDQEFTTPESTGVYAVRITRDHDGKESVISKGTEVGRMSASDDDDESTRIRRLSDLLGRTSSMDKATTAQSMPFFNRVSPKRVRSIYFDMDGTIADLYSVPDWLPKLRAFDPSPYEEASPLVNMDELNDAIKSLQRAGWHVGVVSWLAKNPNDHYSRAVATSKRLWLMRHLPTIDEINLVSYGVAKQTAVANKHNSILVDDEPQNLRAWADKSSGRTVINASVPEEMLRRVKKLASSVS